MHVEITKLEARQRNLKIKITSSYVSEKFKLSEVLSIDKIKILFYFRESDIQNSMKHFFSKKSKGYTLKDNIVTDIKKMEELHNTAIKNFESSKAIYIQMFAEYRENFRKNMMASDSHDNYQTIYKTLSPHFSTLHWGTLPEYNEQIMINRGLLPETSLNEYYNHYHTLEDLYEVLMGILKPDNSFKGDINLNNKLSFRVFSRRWGHEDNYTIERRVDGWYVGHISINGISNKDGTGPLLMNLRHDSIQFPEDGVKYALETLWDMADETEMLVVELQNKLQEIADWISAVEKVVGNYQPEWCNYY
jgi:hypothetical protein